MSRLIFEGDTSERFGGLFPKPFIEEVRVFNDKIETDVSLYFEIEEETEVADFIIKSGLDQLKIYVGPMDQSAVDAGEDVIQKISDPSEELYYQNPLSISSGGTRLVHDIDEFDSDFFYNTEGVKFVRFYATVTDNSPGLFFPGASRPGYLLSYTFYDGLLELLANFRNSSDYIRANAPFSTHMSQEYNRILGEFRSREQNNFYLVKSQVSNLSYEKISNADGTLNVGQVNVFRESDGNAYTKSPIQSLDRTFRKTNNLNHRTVASLINSVISPYFGSIAEADMISTTLSKLSSDPELLIQLQKDINSFSNKSSATPTGQLYGQLVDTLLELDDLARAESPINKRLEFNTKIKDMRGMESNVLTLSDDIRIQEPPTALPQLLPDTHFLSLPYTSRYLHRKTRKFSADEGDYFIENQLYVLFDYEKALNYRSGISKYFNVYNLLQIFGQNSLNKFFALDRVRVIKEYFDNDTASGKGKITLATFGSGDSGSGRSPSAYRTGQRLRAAAEMNISPYRKQFVYDDRVYAGAGGLVDFLGEKSYTAAGTGFRSSTIRPYIAERALEAVERRDNYRLRCFEVCHLESISEAIISGVYEVRTTMFDDTIKFYQEYINEPMIELIQQLNDYLDFAEQFCSYNNIDNRFNDFFNDSIRNEFSEPFVWERAPIYYYSLRALIAASWNNAQATTNFNDRKRDGSLINLAELRTAALSMNRRINPATGDLQSLREFIQLFNDFYDDTIGYNGTWRSLIWRPATDGSDQPMLRAQGTPIWDITVPVVAPIIDSIDLLGRYTLMAAEGAQTVEAAVGAAELYIRRPRDPSADGLKSSLSNLDRKDFQNNLNFEFYLEQLAQRVMKIRIRPFDFEEEAFSGNRVEKMPVRLGDLKNHFSINQILGVYNNQDTIKFISYLGRRNVRWAGLFREEIDFENLIDTGLPEFNEFMRILVPFYKLFGEEVGAANLFQIIDLVVAYKQLSDPS